MGSGPRDRDSPPRRRCCPRGPPRPHGSRRGGDRSGGLAGPVELARALTDLGALQRRLGNRADAREHLRRGLDLAHRNGALALAERAREELIIAGARPRRDALRGRDSLTASEHRITALAAQGRTNNQIAQALFITSRTVETHLTSAYSKLGISSRRELATALES